MNQGRSKKKHKRGYNNCRGKKLSPLERIILNGPDNEVEERIFDIVISERRWLQSKKHMIQKLRMKRRTEVSLDDLDGPTDEELRKIESRMARMRKR